MAPQQTALPRLTLNRLFIEDLMAAQPPCFAMGYVEIQGSVTGFIAVRPKNPIPSRSTDQGFRLGHAVLGNATHQVLQFGFEFYGHTTYHALVNPSNPIVQAVIARMLATKDYFFFAINPDQSVIAFRSHLERNVSRRMRQSTIRNSVPDAPGRQPARMGSAAG